MKSDQNHDNCGDKNDAIRKQALREELLAILEVGERQLDAGLGIPAEEFFERLMERAAELDRQAWDGASGR